MTSLTLNSDSLPEWRESLLDSALAAAKRGWFVTPLHGILQGRDGLVCACPRGGDCDHPGKHSVWSKWVETSTRDAQAIRTELSKPGRNFGHVCGKRSGMWVLDIDPRHGGEDSLHALCEVHDTYQEELEELALVVETGGGGKHLYFDYPPEWGGKRTSISDLCGSVHSRSGIDVRADGNGQAVAPSSRHASGREYVWAPETLERMDGMKLRRAPDWLEKLVGENPAVTIDTEEGRRARLTPRAGTSSDLGEIVGGVSEGGRNDAAARMAGSLIHQFTPEEALEELREWNALNDPPLGDRELEAVMRSIAQGDLKRNPDRAAKRQRARDEDERIAREIDEALAEQGRRILSGLSESSEDGPERQSRNGVLAIRENGEVVARALPEAPSADVEQTVQEFHDRIADQDAETNVRKQLSAVPALLQQSGAPGAPVPIVTDAQRQMIYGFLTHCLLVPVSRVILRGGEEYILETHDGAQVSLGSVESLFSASKVATKIFQSYSKVLTRHVRTKLWDKVLEAIALIVEHEDCEVTLEDETAEAILDYLRETHSGIAIGKAIDAATERKKPFIDEGKVWVHQDHFLIYYHCQGNRQWNHLVVKARFGALKWTRSRDTRAGIQRTYWSGTLATLGNPDLTTYIYDGES